MKRPQIIGLTGGIATGKSTVSQIVKDRGYPVICADKIAADVVKKGRPAYRKVVALFGRDIIRKDGELDRKKIARRVFKDARLKQKLEAIIHPEVANQINDHIRRLRGQNVPLIFLDVPLLFEAGMEALCNKTICIASTQHLQIERLKKYRGMTHAHALDRIRSQMPLEHKIQKADFVIWNNKSKTELKEETDKLLKKLLSQAMLDLS